MGAKEQAFLEKGGAMSPRTTLKWTFFIFCGATAYQLIYFVVYNLIAQGSYLFLRLMPPENIIALLIMALIIALPTLVLADSILTSRIPLLGRYALHFILTFAAIFRLHLLPNHYHDASWLALFLISFFFLLLYILILYYIFVAIKAKEKRQREVFERKYLQNYIVEMESQYTEMRKLQHDYQNILLSSSIYLNEGDFSGFKNFYVTKIAPEAEIIAENDFSPYPLDSTNLNTQENNATSFRSVFKRIPLLFFIATTLQLLSYLAVLGIKTYYASASLEPFFPVQFAEGVARASIALLIIPVLAILLVSNKVITFLPSKIYQYLYLLLMIAATYLTFSTFWRGVIMIRFGRLDFLFPVWSLSNTLVISFIGSLSFLILGDSKITSFIPLKFRHILHFTFMAGATSVFFLFFNNTIIIEEQFLWLVVSIPISSLLIYVCFSCFFKTLSRKRERTNKEQIEWEISQVYLDKIQQQCTTMAKFKQEYESFLHSIEIYLKENNFSGLKDFYSSRIAITSGMLNKSTFAFRNLDKVRIPEIRGIILAKIMLAQSLDIPVSFEANEKIEKLPVDSLTLVRILGIILDNAIEAQEPLENKGICIAFLKYETGLHFLVENPCSENIPPLHKLWERNFSTKENHQGLGLFILLELVNALPNAILETDIVENNFIQKLILTIE